jgi:hypothetical protein
MADKVKVPFRNPDGSTSQEIGTLMETSTSEEAWSVYTLADGTKIRLRQTLVQAVRLDNKKNQNGEPVYSIQSQPTISVIPKIGE